MASTVTLLRRCKTAQGWKRFPAAFGKNGRVRPGYVEIEGRQVLYERGTYELRYYIDRQARYEPAGDSASEALARRDRFQRQLRVKKEAQAAGIQVIAEDTPRAKLTVKMDEHIADAVKRQAMEAAEISRRIATEFLATCRKTFADEVTREDIFVFLQALRRKGNSDRTVANKHARLKSMLLFAAVPKEIIPPKPKYEKHLPTVYEPDQVGALLAHLSGRMKLAVSVLLMCGLREQELMHLQWIDINQAERTLRVRSKPQWDYKVKDSEQRDIPIPDQLFAELKAWHERYPTGKLLFATCKGLPDGHLLRTLKVEVNKAGLHCGVCAGCTRRTNQQCREWTLHRFRRHYLTALLRSGIDLRTAQAYAGHSDLASTMRYLRPASGEEALAKVNAVKWY